MIDVQFRIANAAAAMDALARDLYPSVDDAIGTALAGVISQLIPVTPVRSGLMQRSYDVQRDAPDAWSLVNLAESPAGYPYPVRVAGEPGFSRAYAAIQSVLDQAETDLGADLDVAITRLVAASDRAP